MQDRTHSLVAGRDFVGELVRDPDLVARILAAHVPDVDGRCMGCALTSTLRPPWPCGPREHARLAQERLTPRPRWITP